MTDLTTYEYDIFLSHNRADQEWSTRLAERLEQEEWQGRKLKVFFSPWDIRPGQSIPGKIEEALPKSRKVGLVLSPDAVDSAWVELERLVTTYISVSARDERLIPLYRRDCDIPALLRHIVYLDFRDDANYEAQYQSLLSVVKDEPLPRRSRMAAGNPATLIALIPRPPNVGFVARRDSEGRDILVRLRDELSPDKNQLIALSGPGGVGKTTLAAETARALSKEFGGRAVWTSALGRDDYSLSTLLDEIATQLGQPDLRTLAAAPKAEAVQALIASAPTLIILDNFEPIAEKEQTRCVEFLLNRASCPVLITSRLKIASARNITLPVMTPEEAESFLQLLIEQAGDRSAFREIDWQRIIIASERNPLVLQWVVAQIDLAQDPETVLQELTQGEGDAAERVFDRSFGLDRVGDDGRAALLALSLFAPDASRAALAEVAGLDGDVKRLNDAVKALAGLHLVNPTVGTSRLTVAGLTRELAKARLGRDHASAAYRKRFVAFFSKYAEANAEPKNYDLLEAEKDNLLNAIEAGFGSQNWGSVMLLANAIGGVNGFLYTRGYWDEAIKCNSDAGIAAQTINQKLNEAVFSHRIGILKENRGLYDEARKASEDALSIYRAFGSESNVAVALHQLATVAHRQGKVDEARRLYNESLEIAKKMGNPGGVASTLHQLATLADEQGEFDEAQRLLNESLEISKRLGDQGSIADSLHSLAVLAHRQGELNEARRLYNQSLEINRRLGNQASIASSLHNLAALAERQDELDEARHFYRESLEINMKLGNQAGIASSLHQMGILAHKSGDPEEARRLCNESLEIEKKLGNQMGIAISLLLMGRFAEEEGAKGQALRLFEEALAIFEKLKSPSADIVRRSLDRVKGKSS